MAVTPPRQSADIDALAAAAAVVAAVDADPLCSPMWWLLLLMLLLLLLLLWLPPPLLLLLLVLCPAVGVVAGVCCDAAPLADFRLYGGASRSLNAVPNAGRCRAAASR